MGRFCCETALFRPDTLVIGIERSADALVVGMERALREDIQNVRFILGDAAELPLRFAPGTVDGLYIHFCDPWPHRKKAPRRLTSRNFLQSYRPLLAADGKLTFRTDNDALFEFSLKELAAEGWTVTHSDTDSPPEPVMTDYEIKFRALGVSIKSLTASPPV
jgi:tRNA (guanine-N7-)-methyltransferase